MNDKKTKKVRAFLINFVNEELNKQKRNKKYDILINSIPLDILAKKNMQCKVFVIEENNFFYQQNIDIGWMMGVNYDINSSNYGKSCLNLFTNRMTKEIDKLDSPNEGEEKIEIINKETIIKKNLDSVLYIHHQKDIGSPLGISLFQKKEISEKKFIKENSGIHFSGKISNFFLNKSEKEKGKDKDESKLKDNNSFKEDNFFLIKRLSNITLETELSRIIKCCHEEDYPSSQERCISDSRRSEINKELKMAKMYAKRLNLYCKKLKNKIDKKYNNDDDKKDNDDDNDNNDDNNDNIARKKHVKPKTAHCKIYIKKNDIGKNHKVRSHKLNEIKYTKIKPKRHSEKEKENFSKFKKIEKSKTLKFNKHHSNNKNNNLEHSSKIKSNNTFRENTIIKKSILRTNNEKKRNSLSIKLDRMKQVYFKSPKKGENLKSEKNGGLTSRGYKKLNINEKKIHNDINQNTDDHIKKIIKKKKTQDHKQIEKTSLFRISKMKTIKRGSMENKINHTGLENINFFKMKTNSSHESNAVKAFHKKSPRKKEKPNLINNNINNNSTSISQRKDTSDSSEFISQEYDKKNKFKYIKKNTANFMKRKKDNFEGKENIKKFKKRKTTDYDDTIKIQKLKKISPVKHIRDKRNHTTEKQRHKFGKHENNNIEEEISDFTHFNDIDEFLYKIKLKRSKNNNGVGMN